MQNHVPITFLITSVDKVISRNRPWKGEIGINLFLPKRGRSSYQKALPSSVFIGCFATYQNTGWGSFVDAVILLAQWIVWYIRKRPSSMVSHDLH